MPWLFMILLQNSVFSVVISIFLGDEKQALD